MSSWDTWMRRGRRWPRLCALTLGLLWKMKSVRKSTVSELSRSKIDPLGSAISPTWVRRGLNDLFAFSTPTLVQRGTRQRSVLVRKCSYRADQAAAAGSDSAHDHHLTG